MNDLDAADLDVLSIYDAINGRAGDTPRFERALELLEKFDDQECIVAFNTEDPKLPEIAAAANIRFDAKKAHTWIEGIATHPDYQGLGIGKEMMSYIEQQSAKRKFATVALRAIPGAVTFYSKLGYEPRDGQSHTIDPVMEKDIS